MAALVFRVAGSMLIVDCKDPTTQLPALPVLPWLNGWLTDRGGLGRLPASSTVAVSDARTRMSTTTKTKTPSRFFGRSG